MDKKTISIIVTSIFLFMGFFTTYNSPTEDNSIVPNNTVEEPQYVNTQGLYEEPRIYNWKEEVNKVTYSNVSKSSKVNTVLSLVKRYPPTENEINLFSNHIVSEYSSKRLINNLSNEEYMLQNLFISRSVEYYYDDSKQLLIDKYAYDYMQVVRDLYRGTASINSDFIQTNFEQLNKSLEQLNQQ